MPRGTYLKKKEATDKRSCVLAAYNADGDWRQIASSLGVKTSTAYRWVKEGDKTDSRGGRRHAKIEEEHKTFMVEIIEKNPRITLQELTKAIRSKYGFSVSSECVRLHLDALLYTLKNIRYEPEAANSVINKEKRRQFATDLLYYQSLNLPILYMDETNFNLHISRTEGRSLRGRRCTTVAAGSRGANIHMIGCISSMGLIYHEIQRGSLRKDSASEWVKRCLRRANNEIYGGVVVLVLDNAPCHSGIEDVLKEEEFKMHFVLRLAPYSPMLNPIESVWSFVKSIVKRSLSNKMTAILDGEEQGTLSKTEYRLQAIQGSVTEAITEVTPAMCANFVAHIQNILPSVLNSEDVKF